MAITLTVTTATPVEELGPCGCFACDKWSDCEFCGGCNPDAEAAWEDAQDRVAERSRQSEVSLAEWLYGAGDS